MAKVGRPKSSIEKQRIQCVIPKTIIKKLDSKVKTLDGKDRSKVITTAIAEWLEQDKKKNKYENIYLKLIEKADSTLSNELFLNPEYKDDENVKKIVNEIRGLLIRGKTIPKDKLSKFNKLLKNNIFYLDNNFRLNCDSNMLLNFVFLLLLDQKFPVKNSFGICQYCNKEFIKKRAEQMFCSPFCNIKYQSEAKKKTGDPVEYQKLSKSIEKTKRKNKNYVISFTDCESDDEIKRYKNIISRCCDLAGNKFVKFKKIWRENVVGDSLLMIRSVLILMNEVYFLLLKKTLRELKRLTVDSFLKWGIDEFFPKDCSRNIKRNVAKYLKMYITESRFVVERELCVGYKKLELARKNNNVEYLNYYYQSLVEYSEYFANKFNEDYKNIITNPIIFEMQKNTNIQCSVLRIAYFRLSAGLTDECIEICKDVLKYNCLCIDAHCILIIAYGNKKNGERMIYHYRCIERIMPCLRLLNGGEITDGNRFKKEMLSLRRISDFGYVKGFAAFAYMIEGNNEKALEILKPKEYYESEISRQLRETILQFLSSKNKNMKRTKKA